MKKNKNFEDIKNKTIGELEAKLVEEREKLANLKLNVKVGQEQNRRVVKYQKILIAQILTAMNQMTSESEASAKQDA